MSIGPADMNNTYNGNAKHTGDNVGRDKIVNNYYGNGASAEKKRYTNKELIVPFTKEASNGAQGGTYVQRDDLLGKIFDSFEAQAGKKRMVFLSGMGGSGKSELARAYAESHSEEYDEIFWLTCRDGVRPDLFSLMANADTLEEVDKKDVVTFSDKVLIIIDNCNKDDDAFLFTVEHSTGAADILITTRLNSIGNYEGLLISVESEDRKLFAYSVFKNNYCKKPRWGRAREIHDGDIASVHEICREVQYNTMMVSLIGIRLREYKNLSIFECAKKIHDGVGKLDGNVRYSKDLVPRAEEIKDILEFLFSDILKHHFSDAERAVLTVLSLTPASWYEIDYIVLLCKGVRQGTEYEYAVKELLNLGWLQSSGDSMTIHPLIAEVISDKQITAREPKFFEGLIENYLGMPDQYLGKEKVLIDKIMCLGERTLPENRLAVMLLNNDREFEKLFGEIYPNVHAAYFVYVVYNWRRRFLYRDLEIEKTCLLTDVPSQEKEGTQAEVIRVINSDFPFKLDLSIAFEGKEIEKIKKALCFGNIFLNQVIFSKKLKDIGNWAFFACCSLSGELKLPEGLTRIGDTSFAECGGLTGDLILPDGLKRIETNAFALCDGLNGELRFPAGLTSIGDGAFMGCSRIGGELKLPKGLTSIERDTFADCRGLTGELKLPEGLTKIEFGAFMHCGGLSGTVHLPESLTIIENNAFYGCNALKKIVFYNPNTQIEDPLTSNISTIICGYRNSTAEEYAKAHGQVFEELIR